MTQHFPNTPRIALTATADEITRKDILEKLELRQARIFISSFDRPNIRYHVQVKNRDKHQLLDFIRREHANQSGIVYVRTRKRTESIASWLSQQGVDAFPYHAGLSPEVRMENQKQFQESSHRVIVATIAFDMGIDKPDVRFVAHLDLPSSMEAYYQETGRAGRDGQPAKASGRTKGAIQSRIKRLGLRHSEECVRDKTIPKGPFQKTMVCLAVSRKYKGYCVAGKEIAGGIEDHENAMTRLRRKLKLPESDLFTSPEQMLERAYDTQGQKIAHVKEEKTEKERTVS